MAAAKFEGIPVADLWFRWVDAIRGIVEPKYLSGKISPQDYRNLHSALLRGCRDYGDGDDEMAEKLLDVRRLISPWVTYDSLKAADRRFLKDILTQSESISATLKQHAQGAKKKSSKSTKKRGGVLVWLIAFSIGLGAGLFVLMSDAPAVSGPQHEIERLMLRAKHKLQSYSFLQIFGTVTIVVLLIAGPLMYKTKKS